jgi:hypothetical protein
MNEPVGSSKTPQDLLALHGRGLLECQILRLVASWAGSCAKAQDWLRTPVPSLGAPPLELMRSGHADLVLGYLHRIGACGFA